MTDMPAANTTLGVDVSPSTGLDSEVRAFMGRIMTGYEQANRRLADLCETMVHRAEKAEELASSALESRMKLTLEYEELLSQRHRRELEAEAAKQKQAAFAQVAHDVRVIAPLLLKRLIGIPLTGDDSHGLQDFLSTMTPEQFDTLMGEGRLELSIPQRQQLLGVINAFAAGERKKLEAKQSTEAA